MNALEDEVLRLRVEGEHLDRLAANWKRCTLVLIGPSAVASFGMQQPRQLSPGLFIWTVTGSSASSLLPVEYYM